MRYARWIRVFTVMAVMAVLSLFCVGAPGVASAKVGKHHQSGKGGPSAPMTIQVDPNPLVETSESDVAAVVQVEASPSFAGDSVELSAPEFFSSCTSTAPTEGFFTIGSHANKLFTLQLDNEGNATAGLFGFQCAPGTDLFEASFTDAPFLTATTNLVVQPPTVTTPGVYVYPTTSGTVTGGEVETGDSGPDPSAVDAVFYVETDPVYAEQTVELSSTQLADRCGISPAFESESNLGTTGTTAMLDDDGNAVFLFFGASCAAGSSVVTADVLAGTHPTYTTTFNILPPQPTI